MKREEVKLVKEWLMPGDLGELCEKFGVCRSTASNVLRQVRTGGKVTNLKLLEAIIARAADNHERVENGKARLKSIGA